MARREPAEAAAFRADARRLFFSNASVDAFLASATPGQLAAAAGLLAGELEGRERSKRERLFRKARFPSVKSLEGYDFSQVSFPDGYTREDMLSLAFVERAQDFVFYGPSGRGKTHLAVALGQACVARGWEVRFFTASQLVLALRRSAGDGTLEAFLRDVGRCSLLIVDEFGYVPFDVEGARLLWQVLSDCYERRSVVFTTNIEFSRWGTVMADEKLAAATVDRVVHHGRLVEFGGTSRRIDASLMLGRSQE